MLNNGSNTSLVMIGNPYQHYATNAYKGVPMNAYPQYSPHMNGGNPNDCYLRQQRTIEIIELVEVPPPSRREDFSVPCSSTAASSSYASSSEDESGESYCSSEDANEHYRSSSSEDEPEPMHIDDTFHSRMRRIEQWRDAHAKAIGAHFAPSPSRSKRKGAAGDEDEDTHSRTSKRSRQGAASATASTSTAVSVRSIHSCSACDTCFPDRRSYHKHGFSPRTNEACRAAVEYGFEQ